MTEEVTRVNVTFEKMQDGGMQVTLQSAYHDLDKGYPANPIIAHVQSESLEYYTDKIANYSFVCTIFVVWSFSVLMAQIRLISQNQIMCQSISLASVSMSLIWNFFFFQMHFQYSIQGEYF